MKLNTKLTNETALQIKDHLWEGMAQELIARRFNVSQTTISRILHGKQWGQIPWPDSSVGSMPRKQMAEIQSRPASATQIEELKLPEIDSTHKNLVRDTIERLAEQAQTEMEEAFEDDILIKDSKSRSVEDKDINLKPSEYDFLPWDEILKRAPENEIILAADVENDDNLKLAIGIVFKALTRPEWDEKKTKKLVNRMYQTLVSDGDNGEC